MWYFTADNHFGHANVLKYTDRSRWATTVDEMDHTMIEKWNTVVKPNDEVGHCGDFALCPVGRAVEVARQLRGQKRIVFGNHDKALRKSKEFLACFVTSGDMLTVKVPDDQATLTGGSRIIVLCHYAMRIWDRSHYGAWQLYGHSHGSLPDDPHALSLDVGVDCWDGSPVSYDTLRERMALKRWKPVDHHGE
jgi:calcineurin-like phosphoesterase family protein